MTNIPGNRLDGYRWLIEVKKFELIKLGRSSKTPVRSEKGWAARTTHRSFDDIKFNKNDNAGVLTGRISGIIVLDIDDEVLFPEEYTIPETFTVKTSKGFHHYFRIPDDDKEYRNKSLKNLGYDIRGDGGYVEAPWSKHPDGPIYKVVSEAELVMAPDWLLEISEKRASSTKQTSTSSVQTPAPAPIVLPGGVTIPTKHKKLIEIGVPKVERSERIWYLVNDLIEEEYSDDEIRWIFEKHPAGIGEKYIEKGASRGDYLQGEIERARESYQKKHADPMKAQDQGAVEVLKTDLLTTFQTDYKMNVSGDHEQVIESAINLFIAMYEGSFTGWYALPLHVGWSREDTDNTPFHQVPLCSQQDPILLNISCIREDN